MPNIGRELTFRPGENLAQQQIRPLLHFLRNVRQLGACSALHVVRFIIALDRILRGFEGKGPRERA